MLSINHSSSPHALGSPVAAPEPGVHCEQQRGGQQAAVGGRVEAGQGGGGQPARAQQVRHHTGPVCRVVNEITLRSSFPSFPNILRNFVNNSIYCEAQARVRQGWTRDGPQGERPQSLNPCLLELTLKLVATFPPPPPPTHPDI